MNFREVLAFCLLKIRNIWTGKPKQEFPVLKKPKFPLLQLPRVVLLNCIENLDLLEIILFSLLSKRAKSIAKRIRWDSLNIRLELGYNHRICLSTPTEAYEWIIGCVESLESLEYPYFRSELFDTTASHYLALKNDENGIEDCKKMVKNIWEMFPSSACDMEIAEPSLIEWIINIQPTARCVWIRDDVITSSEALNRLFKSLKVTQYFCLHSYDTYQTAITRPIPYRSVSIDNYWITLPAVLNGTNSVILLSGSRLLPKDINTILKEWQTGTKLQNLEFLQIDIDTYVDRERCYNEMYSDLDLAMSDDNDERPRTINIRHDWIYEPRQEGIVFNLIRNDGKVGSIFGTITKNLMMTKIRFNFQVWSRQA